MRGIIKISAALLAAAMLTGGISGQVQARCGHHTKCAQTTEYAACCQDGVCLENGSCDVDGVCIYGGSCDVDGVCIYGGSCIGCVGDAGAQYYHRGRSHGHGHHH